MWKESYLFSLFLWFSFNIFNVSLVFLFTPNTIWKVSELQPHCDKKTVGSVKNTHNGKASVTIPYSNSSKGRQNKIFHELKLLLLFIKAGFFLCVGKFVVKKKKVSNDKKVLENQQLLYNNTTIIYVNSTLIYLNI